jgi:hypothetical protein
MQRRASIAAAVREVMQRRASVAAAAATLERERWEGRTRTRAAEKTKTGPLVSRPTHALLCYRRPSKAVAFSFLISLLLLFYFPVNLFLFI